MTREEKAEIQRLVQEGVGSMPTKPKRGPGRYRQGAGEGRVGRAGKGQSQVVVMRIPADWWNALVAMEEKGTAVQLIREAVREYLGRLGKI